MMRRAGRVLTRSSRTWAAGLMVALGVVGPAAAESQGVGRARVLIVSGVTGEPQYATAFAKQATTMIDALTKRFGIPESNIVYLAETTAGESAKAKATSTKENVERELKALADQSKNGDVLFVMLIGHGSGEDAATRFSLPGPDMTAADFAKILDTVDGATIAFVNAASASGGFIGPLSGRNRVIATATKSGAERNQTRFATYFVQAYAGDVADADKDGRVSILEAFEYARREVARAFEAENHLLTEHAQLDDNGDRKGTGAPDAKSADGALARRVFLGGTAGSVAAAARAASSDPRVATLEKEKEAIEARIDSLRRGKASMDSTAYEKALEGLLVQLAEKNKAIREAVGGRP